MGMKVSFNMNPRLMIAFIAFALLAVLKLTETIAVSWLIICSPLIIAACLTLFVFALFIAISNLTTKRGDSNESKR